VLTHLSEPEKLLHQRPRLSAQTPPVIAKRWLSAPYSGHTRSQGSALDPHSRHDPRHPRL